MLRYNIWKEIIMLISNLKKKILLNIREYIFYFGIFYILILK